MTPPKALPADLLLAHAEGLRALARRLLRDAHEAEDALQETFLRALARPPQERERVEGWLATVLRSVAHKRLRGEERRRARERASARPERVEAGDDRAALLRAVLEAVLALDPPQRDVVLDRYFEGLAPREIARRRRLPIDTVSSRLARARARLRERLERELGEGGEWRSKLSALFGLPLVPAPLGALPAVLFLMSTHLKLAAAAAAIVLAGLGWYAATGRSAAPAAGPAPAAAALAPSAAPAPAPTPRPAGPTADERSALAAAPEPSPAGDEPRALPPYRYELRVRVLDGEDRPLADAPVDLAPPGGRWNRAGRTDARGELALALRGFEPTLELALSVRAPFGGARAVRRVTLAAGAPTAVAVGLPRAGSFQLVLEPAEDGGGGSFTGWVVTGRSAGPEPPALAAVGDAGAFVEPPRVAAEEPADPDGGVEVADSFTDLFELTPGAEGGQGIRLTFGGFEAIHEAQPEPEPQEPAALARGQVRNAAGHPLAGVRVEARDERGAARGSARTNAEGEYELTPQPAERLTLHVGGGERGLATTEWRPESEPELRWSPVLDRGHELLGRLVDAEGAPLADWIVEVELDDATEPWWDHARTGEDGRFAIPNLPRRALRVTARPGDAPHALAGLALENVWPDMAERELSVDATAAAPGSVRARVVGPDGRPRQGDVRVWQRASGRCAWLEPSASEPGLQRAERLPAGDYELEYGDPELGYAALASFRLQPGEALDLGVLQLPEPATLVLALPEAERVELWRIEAAFEARVLELDGATEGELELRAGDYELRAHLREGRLERRLRLEPGERLELPAPEAR